MIRDKVGSLDGSWDQSWQVLGVPSDFCGWQTWVDVVIQWIGLRENLHETPIFNGKIFGFL